MTLSLTIADNTDATGTATVTGSDPATTNTLYKAVWTGQAGTSPTWTAGQLNWVSVGTRSGDGTIAVSGAGYFAWIVVGTVSSAPAFASTYQPITDASVVSWQEQITTAVKTRIVGLNLPGIASTVIQDRWVLRRLKDTDPLPCIPIAPWGSESFPNQMTNTDDIGYPVAVALLDSVSGSYRGNYSRDTLWRQRVLSAFRYQKLAGAPLVINCIPEPGPIVNASAIVDPGELVSLLVFRFIVRAQRG